MSKNPFQANSWIQIKTRNFYAPGHIRRLRWVQNGGILSPAWLWTLPPRHRQRLRACFRAAQALMVKIMRVLSIHRNLPPFLANVNSSSCSLYVIDGPSVCRLSVVCLSVVCNVGAPYSGDWNFRQYFYAMWYLGHPWTLYKNFTEIVPGEPLRRGS